MLQRIQTIYFFFASIFVIFPIFGLTIFTIDTNKGIAEATAFQTVQGKEVIFENQFYILILIALLCIQFIIFSYKNRKRQIFLGWFVLVFILLTATWMFVGMNAQMEYLTIMKQKVKTSGLEWPVYVFALSIFFVMQGLRHVRKDKKLLESLNRLR